MRRNSVLFPLISILLCLPSLSFSQSWSGIISNSRATDWRQAGIPGGIPNRTAVCATLSASASSAQINSAIAACPSGQVVFLSAGTYHLASGINFKGKSNVSLRGAGPTQTVLQFSGGDSCGGQGGDICIIDAKPSYVGSSLVLPGGGNSALWLAGFTQGTTKITLSSVSGLAVGGTIILDQKNDIVDTGGLFICDTAACHQSGESASSNGRTMSGVDANQVQVAKVTAISGTTVTISPGLYANNWRLTQVPGAWWTSQIQQVGIEDLTVDNTGSGTSINSGVYFYDCNQCWMKNVRSIRGNRNHVWLYQSSNVVIRDSYFYGTQNAAQESYGVETFVTSGNLIENNIFDNIASPIMSSGGSGNVFAYNYSINNYYNVSPSWMQNSYSSHDAGNTMNLFEGNDFNAIDCDDIHGSSGVITYFRNRLTGTQSGKSLNTHATNLYSFCRGINVVGNVLGTVGYHTQYEASPSVGSKDSCSRSIYIVGFGTSECGSGTPGNDSLVKKTLLRWGNWDAATKSTQWEPSEVPTAGVPFIGGNPVPGSQDLPTSFYLSSKPSFWGSTPWPAVGPDVAGSDPTGHAFVNPAEACYQSGSFSSGVMNFDASDCYGSSSTPAGKVPDPPTNLKVVVQ